VLCSDTVDFHVEVEFKAENFAPRDSVTFNIGLP